VSFGIGIGLLFLSSVFTLVITRLLGQLAGIGVSGASMPGEELMGLGQFQWDVGTTSSVVLLLFVLLLVQGAISFARVWLFARVTENAMLTLRQNTFETIIRMPIQFFNESRVGELGSRISADITTIQETITLTLAELIRQLIIIVVGIGALVIFSWKLTLIMLGSVPVMMVVAVIFGKFIRTLSKKTQDKVAESNVIVTESLTGIAGVKAFANEFFEVGRYMKSIREIRSFAMTGAVWRGLFGTFIIVFVFGALALVIWQGAELMNKGELDSKIFFTFLLFTGLVAGSIGGIAGQFGSLQRGLGAIENVMDIIDYRTEEIRLQPERTELGLRGEIEFNNVSFRYESRPDVEVLRDISFRVPSGSRLALVGPSGSGKSTLASLVLRFYEPNEGSISVDGRPASDYHLSDLRHRMALVPQEVILFGGTIRDNIAYGRPEATEADIREAARRANALEFIQKFPEGLDTVVGERGVKLSGGQRQRIAIARAILKNPAILILDEATSSLDSESERLVQAALEELMKGRTSIVIAHRLSTIRTADRILVLSDGRIAESGTHPELMGIENGIYRKLVELQEVG
jgi:ABC-type multidrug transport system fused ATPase/permease subunit